tara:strand:- start:880 stop:1140 length:261 start_codon:yes stop_codon:yes gene_type:complete
MAITKQKVVDKVEILEDGIIQIREAIRVYDDDGSLIGEKFNRYLLVPGQDVTAEKARIRRICTAVWDAQTVADYIAKQPIPRTEPI